VILFLKGQLLGYNQKSNDSGPHLHYEVRAGYGSKPASSDVDKLLMAITVNKVQLPVLAHLLPLLLCPG